MEQFRALARQALTDLFDQREPFGRLALVQVLMLAGDTLVTISLAGSLFFSISPTEAKSKVLLYLLLTLAPFAVVSPLLGPLIDRSRGARRAMVVLSATGRAVLCPFMARDIHSLLLFPEAFLILVLSKVYLVTRGALVPEMVAEAATEGTRPAAGMTNSTKGFSAQLGYAGLNARLTLLGTLAGFVASVPGIAILKLAGAPGVLLFAACVFVGGAIAGMRLPVLRGRHREATTALGGVPPPKVSARRGDGSGTVDRDLARLQPIAHPEVLFGLSANALLRGVAGFFIFLLAFGLRREHAALWWYGLALGASGIGALIGLTLVPRLRQRLSEQQLLLGAIWLVSLAALIAAAWHTLLAQVFLALIIGISGALGQPSFDALTQRYVAPAAQGRAFARFATRQQLVWVVGALIPVIIVFPLADGDVFIAVIAAVGGVFYLTSRRALRQRALPGNQERPEPA